MNDQPNPMNFLLLQVRDPDDPMQVHEIESFARVLKITDRQIRTVSLLDRVVNQDDFQSIDMVLLGGSGKYSAAGEGDWLDSALESLRKVYESGLPTFASCWGCQAFARAMGGEVINDPANAEVGSYDLFLTEAGLRNPVFAPLGNNFTAQVGHEDRVSRLPEGTTILASSKQVEVQAWCFDDRPIYCTQFHPELQKSDLVQRVKQYPEYIERIMGVSEEEFLSSLRESKETELLLPRFIEHCFQNSKD